MSALFKCQNAAAGEIKLIISDIFKPMNELTFFFRLAVCVTAPPQKQKESVLFFYVFIPLFFTGVHLEQRIEKLRTMK